MCYGIKCRGHPATLTKSSDDKSKAGAARKRNDCGVFSPNRCSKDYKPKPHDSGFSCDEYPFASTLQGQRAGTPGFPLRTVTRCVPARENSVQGGKVSRIYRGMNDGDSINIVFDFQGAKGTKYCANPPVCTLDKEQSNT